MSHLGGQLSSMSLRLSALIFLQELSEVKKSSAEQLRLEAVLEGSLGFDTVNWMRIHQQSQQVHAA